MVIVRFIGIHIVRLMEYLCHWSFQVDLGNYQWWNAKRRVTIPEKALQRIKTLHELTGILRTNAEVFIHKSMGIQQLNLGPWNKKTTESRYPTNCDAFTI